MNSDPSAVAANSIRVIASASCAAALLSACGGGGDSGVPVTPPAASTTLTGVAAKGLLKSALVTAFPVNDAGVVGGTEITHQTTDASGAYALGIGGYTGAVQLVVTAPAGATTADEASGQDIALPSTFTLHANTVVAAPTVSNQTQSASITSYTELASNIAKDAGGVTAASIANANGVVFALIGLDPVATVPLASNAAPPAGATEVQKRYALFNAAVSKLAGSTPQTTDAGVLACYAGAGADLGRKIAWFPPLPMAASTRPALRSRPPTRHSRPWTRSRPPLSVAPIRPSMAAPERRREATSHWPSSSSPRCVRMPRPCRAARSTPASSTARALSVTRSAARSRR